MEVIKMNDLTKKMEYILSLLKAKEKETEYEAFIRHINLNSYLLDSEDFEFVIEEYLENKKSDWTQIGSTGTIPPEESTK
jgi:hypothetical protein